MKTPGSGTPVADPAASLLAQLRRWLAEGRYAAGTRLAEEAVAQDLGVSRTPVRLAFRTLAQEGLLESAGKRGFLVRSFTAADVRCAVEVRGVLEGLAARRLAERGATAQERGVLQQCLTDGDALLSRGPLAAADVACWSALNARFHATLVRATGNQEMARVHWDVTERIRVIRRLDFTRADRIDATYAEHGKILRSIIQRKVDQATLLLRSHIEQSKTEVRKITLATLHEVKARHRG